MTATTDRKATASLILNVAVGEAIDLIRDGQPATARETLQQAGESAARVLGGTR